MTALTYKEVDVEDPQSEVAEHRRRRYEHWKRLQRAKIESWNCNTIPFPQWLESQWGLRIYIDAAGQGYTDEFTVVDEKKYLMYLLKFG